MTKGGSSDFRDLQAEIKAGNQLAADAVDNVIPYQIHGLEFFRYAARVGISILLEPQEAFQPVNFPLCQEKRILLCTFIAFTLI